MPDYDILIRNGKIIDGSGNPWFYGDLAIQGKQISTITPPGRIQPENASEIVDAAGHVVCPGFIDIQSHSIAPLMIDGRSLSKITQGVTTEIMGEGWTPAPFGGGAGGAPRPLRRRLQPESERLLELQKLRRQGRSEDFLADDGFADDLL